MANSAPCLERMYSASKRLFLSNAVKPGCCTFIREIHIWANTSTNPWTNKPGMQSLNSMVVVIYCCHDDKSTWAGAIRVHQVQKDSTALFSFVRAGWSPLASVAKFVFHISTYCGFHPCHRKIDVLLQIEVLDVKMRNYALYWPLPCWYIQQLSVVWLIVM